jgi:hypothetical protein
MGGGDDSRDGLIAFNWLRSIVRFGLQCKVSLHNRCLELSTWSGLVSTDSALLACKPVPALPLSCHFTASGD